MAGNRRQFISSSTAGLAGAALAACGGSVADTPKPTTFMLVHGSWHGAWCFERLRPLLEVRGHAVIAKDLPGRGLNARFPASYAVQPRPAAFATEASPVAAVTLQACVDSVVQTIEAAIANGCGPVVLLGHSSGGITIQAVGERLGNDKIKRLVYLTAWMQPPGLSVLDLIVRPEQAGSLAAPLFIGDPAVTGALRLDPNSSDASYAATAKSAFYGDVADDVVAATLNLLTPDDPLQPYTVLGAVTAARWGAIPRTMIKCSQDLALRPASIDRMVAEADALTPSNPTQVVTLATSHSPFLSQPQALADILLTLA
jgi:pimeloyl-ACP methyl ester carboxylesterase